MFRFANDILFNASERTVNQYPELADFLKKQMQVHTFKYVFSMSQISRLQPDITSPLEAANAISIMLQPYGWVVSRDGVSISIKSTD